MFLINKIFFISLLNFGIDDGATKPTNNACKRFEDYFNSSKNKNCYYNPDNFLETPHIIKKYTGVLENYTVTTEDGYVLQMFRIPRKNPKGVILLQHGLSVDSRFWVGQGNTSLAFFLWNHGYDVWLNNHRGTTFSQKHQSLPVSDYRYWNFSFHEVGLYDIPSQIELMKKVTNVPKIIYIGHSFGTSSGLVYGSAKSSEANRSVKGFIFMGTACMYQYATTIFRLAVPFKDIIQPLTESLRLSNVLFFLPILPISRALLRLFPFILIILNIIFSFIFGMTPGETDPEIFNYDVATYLKPFSWKSLMHYLQLLAKETKFQMYDYGEKKNLKHYNSKTPPTYPLGNFSVPIFFISSSKDGLTTLNDTELLLQFLPKSVQNYGHYKISHINHLQYVMGKHRQIYYKKLLSVVDDMALLGEEDILQNNTENLK